MSGAKLSMEDENLNGFQLGTISVLPQAICIFGVISHVLLITAYVKDPLKCFDNSGTYLMKNLAASDFLTCFLASFSRYVPKKWFWLLRIFWIPTTTASVLTIASISFERFFMVVYPMKHRVLTKGKVMTVWSVCIWLFGFILQLTTFFFFPKEITALITVTIFVELVIVIAGIIYGITYYKLKKQSNNLALENVSNQQRQTRNAKEKRFLKTIIIIACIEFACVVPTSLFYHLAILEKLFINSMVARITNGISTGLYHLNFAVNPLVYVLRLPNYRKTFYLLYCCKKIA